MMVVVDASHPGKPDAVSGCTGASSLGSRFAFTDSDGRFIAQLNAHLPAEEPVCVRVLADQVGYLEWADTASVVTRFTPVLQGVTAPETVQFDLRVPVRAWITSATQGAP